MDRYQKVEKPRPESAAISENEIRITSQGLIRNYVNYASSLLQERNLKVIVLKAMGMAISKAVAATEIIKKWNPHLHQDVSISSVSITDVWEPIEEGLVPLETKRLVSVISITLSIIEPKKKTPGYQAPAQVEQPKRQQKSQQLQQPQQQQQQHRQTLGQLNQDSYGRERSRGSVRGRGWARGGYGGYNNDQGGYYGYRNNQGGYNGGGYNGGGYNGFSYNQGGYGGYRSNQENGGWNANWSRGGGSGRGWNSRGAGPVYGGGFGGGPGGGGRSGNVNGGGRGYVRGRGRVGSRGRGGY
ncbi:TATA-binding protein-associated factor 2N-like [Zingiber officinale]|uniref:TATA-binding protein-associated factor 2N-like n=1 Tax=Zingiber officinale TaxID=94328 RepID=UPI001C4C21D8|nr:TATA-binding protein-associated factor 2N-like [Zingiber officinale]